MILTPAFLAFAVIVLTSYVIQTVAGFGSMIVALTFGAHLLPIRELVTLAVPVSMLQSLYIAARHRDGIDWRLLAARILPLMGGGLALGYVLSRRLAGQGGEAQRQGLLVAFGLMVLVLALYELARVLRETEAPAVRAAPSLGSSAALVGAGVVHGIYATGGPLLVYALGHDGLPKHRFRSTLSAIWVIMNGVLAINFWLEGRYDRSTIPGVLALVPAVPLGLAIGEALHHRVDERRFKILVFALLAAAALSLLARALAP